MFTPSTPKLMLNTILISSTSTTLMNTSEPISALCEFIRLAREKVFRSAKEFWNLHQDALETSYSHYSSIERSKKFPDIRLALRIAKILKLDPKLICHLWASDQMPDAGTRAFFEPQPGTETRGIPNSLRFDLDNFYIFSERQIEDLKKRPEAWEVLMFIMAFSDSTPPDEQDIAESLGFELKVVRECIEWLRNEAIVIAEGGKLKSRKEFFHLPNTDAFKEIRDRNFRTVTNRIISSMTPQQLAEKTAYRTTYIRRLTEKQAIEISEQIDRLIAHVGNLDNQGDTLYALTVGFGPRAVFRKKAQKVLSTTARPTKAKSKTLNTADRPGAGR